MRDKKDKKEEEKRNHQYEEELKFKEGKLKVKQDNEKKLEKDRNKSLKESSTKLIYTCKLNNKPIVLRTCISSMHENKDTLNTK